MRFSLEFDGRVYEVTIRKVPELRVSLDGEDLTPKVRTTKKGFQVRIGSRVFSIVRDGDILEVNGKPRKVFLLDIDYATETSPSPREPESGDEAPVVKEKQGAIRPPMPGRIVSIAAKAGQRLRVGSPLLVLEAMKMQNEISSSMDGVVKEIRVKPGDLVDVSDVMIVVEQA
ncbi:MAG: biotin/lipoyl-containing protein [Thermoplasmata archaeon]